MALDEVSYLASRLAISPTALLVNTPPKAIKWRHLEGSFSLVLSAVTSRMRLQLKQDGKPIIITTLNKLSPAQKRLPGAPRLQYQDSRMSFRYPSSPQVDNGLSERFQLTLDDQASVRLVVQKLTPFFIIVAPKATVPESQATTTAPVPSVGATSDSSSAQTQAKKRKFDSSPDASESSSEIQPVNRRRHGDVNSTQASESASRPIGARESEVSSTVLVHRPSVPAEPSPCDLAEFNVGHRSGKCAATNPSLNPHQQKSSDVGASTVPLVDSAMDAFKASLLQGFRTGTARGSHAPNPAELAVPALDPGQGITAENSGESTLTDAHQQSSASKEQVPSAWTSSETLVSARLDLRNQPTQLSRISPEADPIDIDLLPRSPLVDTSSPPHPLVARPIVSLGIETDLLDLHFSSDGMEDDSLAGAYPPMMTPYEERVEREKRRMDEEEWEAEGEREELLLSSVAEASLELQTVWRGSSTSTVAQIDNLIRQIVPNDSELRDALQRGDISSPWIDLCYRIIHLAELGYAEAERQDIAEISASYLYGYELVPNDDGHRDHIPRSAAVHPAHSSPAAVPPAFAQHEHQRDLQPHPLHPGHLPQDSPKQYYEPTDPVQYCNADTIPSAHYTRQREQYTHNDTHREQATTHKNNSGYYPCDTPGHYFTTQTPVQDEDDMIPTAHGNDGQRQAFSDEIDDIDD